jgi:hypothetical protein
MRVGVGTTGLGGTGGTPGEDNHIYKHRFYTNKKKKIYMYIYTKERIIHTHIPCFPLVIPATGWSFFWGLRVA